MLNIRFLYTLLDSNFIRVFLGLAAVIGIGVLADIIIILKLSLLIGPWITMAILSANAVLGIRIAYSLTDRCKQSIMETVGRGRGDHDQFFRYLATLITSLFLVVPGFINTIAGAVLLIPAVSIRFGKKTAEILGIDWREAYEYLRLDGIAGNN